MITHPLQGAKEQRWLWYLLLSLFVPLAGVLFFIPLEPSILAFELWPIKTISAWDSTEKLWAAFSLGLDFLFLVVYSTLLSLLCIRFTSSFQSESWACVGIVLAWCQWVAASFDAIENIALVVILFGSQNNFIALISTISSIIKFALILIGIIYIITGIFISSPKIHKNL